MEPDISQPINLDNPVDPGKPINVPRPAPDLSSPTEMQESGVDKSEDIHMRRVREKYKDQLGAFEINPIDENGENLGYVLKNKDNPAIDGAWILSDLDDTLIGTQEVKPQMEQQFFTYFRNLGLDLAKEQVSGIVKTTDKFARWQEIEDGSHDYYHPIAHGIAIQEVKDALLEAKKSGNIASLDQVLEEVYENMNRIKLQLETGAEPEPGDHFRFNKDKKFVIKRLPPWDDDIARIFMQTKVTPPEYEKNINAITEDGEVVEHPQGKVFSVNKGIFTSGIPSFQLEKLAQLIIKHPELKFNTLLFTKVGKGDFLRRFIEQEGIRDEVIVVYDDGVGNIQAIEEMGRKFQEQTHNRIKGIVAKTPFAKDAGQQTNAKTIVYDSTEVGEIRNILNDAIENEEIARSDSD